jgi:hypothetical protein
VAYQPASRLSSVAWRISVLSTGALGGHARLRHIERVQELAVEQQLDARQLLLLLSCLLPAPPGARRRWAG